MNAANPWVPQAPCDTGCLHAGTDPAGPHYWGPDASYHQHHVEMGLMAIALQIATREL